MLSGILKHHFGAYPALFCLVILAGHQSCSARKYSGVDCAPSSCGNIHNISYPFRLSTDPNSCGNKKYELNCENNRPALYLKGVKYYVQAIHYSNFTIRVVDADVQKDDCFSIPRHSLFDDDSSDNRDYYLSYISTFAFMSCPNPILSPPHYIVDASSCKNGSPLLNFTSNISSPSSHNMKGNYSYVLIDVYSLWSTPELRDIPDLCHVNLIYPAPYTDAPKNITSYIDVRDSILYGFDFSWSFRVCCDSLKENPCKLDEANISMYCNIDIEDLRRATPIRIAMGFLTNHILKYLVVILVWPVNKYLPSTSWIVYQSSRDVVHDWTEFAAIFPAPLLNRDEEDEQIFQKRCCFRQK